MEERLPRSMLLRTARANAMVIADLGGLDSDGQDYPISCLDSWINRAHPRLTPSERRRRLNSLRERLTSTRRVRTENQLGAALGRIGRKQLSQQKKVV